MKKFGYKEIAKLANVSVATVSRYFTKGYIAKETKKRIEAILRENEYMPSLGSKLVKDRLNTIFVIATEECDMNQYQIIHGIEQGARSRGKSLLLSKCQNNMTSYIQLIKQVLYFKPYSLVLFTDQAHYQDILDYLEKNCSKIPYFVYNTDKNDQGRIKVRNQSAFQELVIKFSKTFDKKNTLVYIDDPYLGEEIKRLRYEGFKQGCERERLNNKYFELDWKDPMNVKRVGTSFYRLNLVNIVCASHNVFLALASSGDKNIILTDVGYSSAIDSMERAAFKVFVDYVRIGLEIEKVLYESTEYPERRGEINYSPRIVEIIPQKKFSN
ncbi:LacI family DNA-binding transcriptional regulator [Mycoplasmopsis columbinasalis]|uniref:LacI family transcriptional regulator n=1 Tax=Mycoplasmopsis columbinasalis TaxID=114880 RepID=A0A449BA31_9BACT|nr:LacI family DNA-binding transcriptional regulator [Mycoplasmopsis columbinasalis]VEU78053.1 LacI family transcriptional regulator [Mycoplasmopsis columbinasalis]